MKTRLHAFFGIVFAALAILCFLWAWLAHGRVRGIEAKSATLTTQNASLRNELRALPATLPFANNARVETAAAVSTPAKMSEPTREAMLEKFSRESAEASLRAEQLKKDPALQKKYFVAMRADIAIVYGPFFRIASLSQAEVERLTDVLLKREEYEADLRAIKNTRLGGQADPVWEELLEEARVEADVAADAILGDDNFEKFRLYERERSAWSYAGQIAAGLALADLPMSFEQSEQLAKLMASASVSYQQGKTANLNEVDWNVVDAEARKIMTPGQFNLFSTTQFIGTATLRGTGGYSRWSAEFSSALNNALESERAASGEP